MVSTVQPTVPVFQGNGYDTWNIKMMTFLIYEELWELVYKGYVEEELPTDDIGKVRKKDVKALLFIQQGVAESIFPIISKATKSKEAWDALQSRYQNTTKVAAPQNESDSSQTEYIITTMDDSVYKAAAKGNIEVLETIPESELLVQLSPENNTILHIASEFGQVECVKWILNLLPSCPSLLQKPNSNGDTALHHAAREGHLEVVQALINAARQLPLDIETGIGADKVMLRTENKGKNTALHEAVQHWQAEMVELLIGQDPNFTYGTNDSGVTPLYMATERGYTDMVKTMIEKSSDSPLYTGLMGRTALHAAVKCDDRELTDTILAWRSDLVKEVDVNGWSPLHFAAERGCQVAIVSELLKTDRSLAYLQTKDGKKTALHIASFHHHKKIVEEILSHAPACREQVDDNGNNVFHFAVMEKGSDDYHPSYYLQNEWLKSLACINKKNAEGNTPLHLLSSYQNYDIWFITDYRTDKKEYNNENLTSYDVILRAKKDISGEKDKIQYGFEMVMPETRSWSTDVSFRLYEKKKASKEYKEKYTTELKKQGETHLIVSALITTVTFAAGFTLPGGYKEEDGKAILSKKAAFIAFDVTDTVAMVSSLCAVFLHFFMTLRKREEYLEGHLLWAFVLIMVGMGSMVLAFATGLFVVLPHSSALSFLTCILCFCFFLCFGVEYLRYWRGVIGYTIYKIFFLPREKEE